MSQTKPYYKLLWLGIFILLLPVIVSAQQTAPPTPSGVSYTATSSYISIYWNDVAGEDSYKIEREIQGSMSWTVVANPGANSTYHNDSSNIISGTIYNYKLYACAGTMCSEPAWLMSVQAGSTGGSTPSAPSYINANVSGSAVNLSWGTVSTATHYNVQRSTYPTAASWTGVCSTEGSNSTSCSDSPSNGTYQYRVEACQSGYGCSGAWNGQYAYTTSAVTVGGGSGNTCTGLTLTTNKTSYTIGEDLSWTWSCYSGVATSYAIELVKPDNSVWPYTNGTFGTGQSSYSGSFGTGNLLVGIHTLRACFTVGCPTVNASAVFTMTSSDGGGGGSLTAPYLTITTSGMTANLTWTDPSGNAETGFKIFRRYTGSSWPTTPIFTQPPNITTYTDTITTSGSYEYKVQVYTSTASQDSNTVTVSVGSGGSLTAPYLNYTVSGMQVYLSWTDPSGNAESGFRIYRKLSTDSTWPTTTLATLGPNAIVYTDTMPTTVTYNYKVQVYTSTTSLDSNSVAVTAGTSGGGGDGASSPPAPGMPIGPVAVATGTSASYAAMLYDQMSAGTRLYMQMRAIFDWGDGTTSETSLIYPEASGTMSPSVTHTWSTAGTYNVRAKARSVAGVDSGWSGNLAVTVGGGTSGTCTGLNLTLNKTAYAIGENVDYTWACTPGGTATFVQMQLLKPDGSVVIYNTYSGAGQSSMSMGFGTANLTAGSYTLQACFSATCLPVTASAPFSVSTSTVNAPPAPSAPQGPSVGSVGQNISVTAKLYPSTNTTSESLQAVIDWGDNTYFSFSEFIEATTTGAYSPSVTHTYAASGTYNIRAKARNSAGQESGWSGNLAITISGSSSDAPLAPSNLSVVYTTTANIKLHWIDNANNEDKFNVGKKLSTAATWSTAYEVQLQAPDITIYDDTMVTSGTTYDYRVQACRSGSGCSAYTYLSGVTAGSADSNQYRAVTVKMANNAIVPYGAVTFVRDGTLLTASLINSSSTIIYLLPGEYDMQPGFPGVNSEAIVLAGQYVNNRKLNIGSYNTEVQVTIPVRLPVNFIVNNSAGEPITEANVVVNITGTTAYASTYTDSAGTAWLQLPAGTYQGLVNKGGYLTKNTSWTVSETAKEFIITLESLPRKVTGKVLVGTTAKANAIIRAVNVDDGSLVIVNSDSAGQYAIYLKIGNWRLYAIADGYAEGDSGTVTLSSTDQTRDLTLGALKQLIQSSANIVPTVSVTVTAAELGVSVGLPANSLGGGSSATVTIRESTQAVTTALAAPLPRSVRDVTASSGGQIITNLASSASIELSYTDSDLTSLGVGSSDSNGLKVAYWNETNNEWQVLTSVVDTANRKVRAATNHFTLFAIVLPFLAQPAAAETTTPPTTPVSGEARATQLATIIAEGTKVYVSCSECLATSVNMSRDEALEQKYNKDIVARVVGTDIITAGAKTIILNFVTYGTTTTIALGAGERGGVVSSFRSAYGHLPNSEYEWQEVLKIANGRWPGTLLPEREQAMKTTFSKIYLREAVVSQANDSAALSIMAYGLRSAKRNLNSEASAITSFRAIYGYSPSSATHWDAVRAVAYSGAKR